MDGLMASAPVMGGILMEVSREWEEWSRVTGATRREHERTRRGTIGAGPKIPEPAGNAR